MSSTKHWTCGECFQTFTQPGTLNRHRERHHSKNHLCLLCVPGAETPIDGKIGEHLKNCHEKKGLHTCQCCHYLFDCLTELNIHKRSMRCTGQPGYERILAKSKFAPGTLAQEHIQKMMEESVEEEEPKPVSQPEMTQPAPPMSAELGLVQFLMSLMKSFPQAINQQSLAVPVTTTTGGTKRKASQEEEADQENVNPAKCAKLAEEYIDVVN